MRLSVIKTIRADEKNGAGGRTDLEPAALESIIAELKDWPEVLNGEPEVIHKLAVLAEADWDAGLGPDRPA